MEFQKDQSLPDVLLIKPDVHGDSRGYFMEVHRESLYAERGVAGPFVQDNISRSSKGVLRGLHYQVVKEQGKLLCVLEGEVLDVAVDIRRGSPTFGKWTTARLTAQGHEQIYVPEGFAHGFYVTSEFATVLYKCTNDYSPTHERGVRWDDPALGIEWGAVKPMVSERDSRLPMLGQVPDEDLPVYEEGMLE